MSDLISAGLVWSEHLHLSGRFGKDEAYKHGAKGSRNDDPGVYPNDTIRL